MNCKASRFRKSKQMGWILSGRRVAVAVPAMMAMCKTNKCICTMLSTISRAVMNRSDKRRKKVFFLTPRFFSKDIGMCVAMCAVCCVLIPVHDALRMYISYSIAIAFIQTHPIHNFSHFIYTPIPPQPPPILLIPRPPPSHRLS